ncbi:MAG: hypothetical protein VX667_06895 [Nitrospinota bacterium]|nr:hypothetical protein [Nitrospinota bacterium]
MAETSPVTEGSSADASILVALEEAPESENDSLVSPSGDFNLNLSDAMDHQETVAEEVPSEIPELDLDSESMGTMAFDSDEAKAMGGEMEIEGLGFEELDFTAPVETEENLSLDEAVDLDLGLDQEPAPIAEEPFLEASNEDLSPDPVETGEDIATPELDLDTGVSESEEFSLDTSEPELDIPTPELDLDTGAPDIEFASKTVEPDLSLNIQDEPAIESAPEPEPPAQSSEGELDIKLELDDSDVPLSVENKDKTKLEIEDLRLELGVGDEDQPKPDSDP